LVLAVGRGRRGRLGLGRHVARRRLFLRRLGLRLPLLGRRGLVARGRPTRPARPAGAARSPVALSLAARDPEDPGDRQGASEAGELLHGPSSPRTGLARALPATSAARRGTSTPARRSRAR